MDEINTPCDVTVLYVEDETATQNQVNRMLTARGYRVLLAGNGCEGLDLYQSHSPDIVLVDIMMPIMNGLDMAREIRKVSPHAQIIVLTAYNSAEYLLDCIDIGINQFVIKPVEVKKLISAIDRCQRVVQLEAELFMVKKLEAIGIMAGGMAHDFNNLLQIIMGYISLAKMSSDPGSKVQELLASAEKSSVQARELGQRLLTFAKGGDGFMQSIPLAPIITKVVDVEFLEAGIISVFDLPADMPHVKGVETQMLQVISSLAVNAREAMPAGGKVRVAAHACSISERDGLPLLPGDYVHVIFSDNGIGIQPENLPRIFDPYFTTKEMGNRKGTGLGLALCYSILRKHDGMITAESTPGEGTSFHLYLPVASGNVRK